VLGSFRCAREVLAGMVARRRGRIVNVSSGAGFNRLPADAERWGGHVCLVGGFAPPQLSP